MANSHSSRSTLSCNSTPRCSLHLRQFGRPHRSKQFPLAQRTVRPVRNQETNHFCAPLSAAHALITACLLVDDGLSTHALQPRIPSTIYTATYLDRYSRGLPRVLCTSAALWFRFMYTSGGARLGRWFESGAGKGVLRHTCTYQQADWAARMTLTRESCTAL
jgi:hypothetical protein